MDDLVAELTLRLRNEMTSGIDAVRAEFNSLGGSLDGLRDNLGAVDRLMAEMPVPAGLQAAIQGLDAEVDGTTAAIREMGASLDAEAVKARDLFAETSSLQAKITAPVAENAGLSEWVGQVDELRQGYTAVESDAQGATAATRQIGAALEGDVGSVQALIGETTKLQEALAAPRQELPEVLTEQFHQGTQAANEMAAAVGAIGGAIDSDSAKMQALLTQMHMDQAEMGAAAPTAGSGGVLPPGISPQQPSEPEEPSGRKTPAAPHGGGPDIFGWMLGGLSALSGFDQWSEYDTAAKQITVTEGLGPQAAQKEASRLKDLMTGLANTFGNSSQDLMNTYAFLITDSLSKATVEGMLPSLAEASTAYNVPTSDIAQAAFTLNKNLGIPPDQMGDALAVLHHASMKGHFTMEDFSRSLPEIGGQMGLIGMTGMPADVTAASSLEMIRRNTGTGGDAATELKEFLTYMHSMMALRMFDRTKRMEDMLGPSGKAIFDKYHIQPLDLPQYLDHEKTQGVDPINALTDYFTHLLEPVKSPIERADLVGAYFHNQQAQDAMLALVQYREDFDRMQTQLSHVSDKTLGTDFQTATSGGSGDSKVFHESLSQAMRLMGSAADYLAISPLDYIWRSTGPSWSPPASAEGSPGPSFEPRGAGITLQPHIPITVNVHVDKDGNATVSGGLEGAPNVTPGTNVRVNQGHVLTGVH